MATKINIRTLLEAGCHFGHQTRRWNPKMKPFIFGERNGIYILDLKQTILDADQAYTFVKNVAKGGNVLFVGTKKQAQEAVKNAAERANMPYINQRWLGGMLTNFVTIRSRINRMEELEAMVEDGRMAVLPKKEQAVLGKELTKLQTNLGGARDMKGLPQALFVIDTKREENAIKEAQRLNIPVVALIDTNSDPDEVEYGIPCNDDAISAVTLMCELMADACLAGSGKEQVSEAEMAAEPKAENGALASYIHMGGKIGVLVEFAFEKAETAQAESFKTFAHDVALQVAAVAPICATRDQVPAETVEHEKQIYMAQAAESGKPEAIQEKMAVGRLEKFYKQSVLTEQEFIKDSSLTIKKYAEQVSKELGDTITVVAFDRLVRGE